MSDNDQAAAILAGIMSTFGECAEVHPEKQLPMAIFILAAIRKGDVPIPGMVTEAAHAHAVRYAEEQKARADKAERERDEANEECREKQVIIERFMESERQAEALLRDLRVCRITLDALNPEYIHRIDAFLAGQPALAQVVDDAMVERANAAYVEAVCKYLNNDQSDMDENPMRAALVAALEGRT